MQCNSCDRGFNVEGAACDEPCGCEAWLPEATRPPPMIGRRSTAVGMLAYGLSSLSRRAEATGPGRVYRIGVLLSGAEQEGEIEAFVFELAKRGYVEGKNLIFEWRAAPSIQSEAVSAAARDLVSKRVDLVFAGRSAGALAAKAATRTIPIVFLLASDPVAEGLVESLARPGGNVTGNSGSWPDVTEKTLGFLVEAVGRPALRIADIQPRGTPTMPFFAAVEPATRAAVQKLGVTYDDVYVDSVDEIEAVLQRLVKQGIGAIVLSPYAEFRPRLKEIASLLVKYRMPSLGRPTDGFLLQYGPDYSSYARRSAEYVDRILRGTPAGTLPVEQPTTFALTINLKTANSIGLVLPKSLLLRADRLIQ